MSLLLSELLRDPTLGLRVLAGAGGTDRTALWAHACELRAPWDWLEPGDLLLSNGLGIPVEPGEQLRFLEHLDEAGISGLVIGEAQHAPELLAGTVAAADHRRFPILECAYHVPFVAVSRAVGLATMPAEHGQLRQVARIYGRAREAAARRDGAPMLAAVSRELGCGLWVLDPATGAPLLPADAAPGELGPLLRLAADERAGRMPALTRLEGTAVAVPVPSRRAAMLVAVPTGTDGAAPALALLQHVATVAALDVERAEAERERRRRQGSDLLAHALDGRLDPISVSHVLAEHGFDPDRSLAVVVLTERDGDALGALLDARLHDAGVPHLLLRRDGDLLLLLPFDDEVIRTAGGLLDDATSAGVSDPLEGLARIGDAVREARLARAHRTEQLRRGAAGEGLASYGEADSGSPFLPATVRAAEAVAHHVLGAVLAYDRDHGTDLLPTVEAFLAANRSWRRTAEDLQVHRQTLVYRVRRFEEITGRHLDDTGDVAEVWFALRALRLEAPPARPGPAA